MFGRLEESQNGMFMPNEWQENFIKVLTEVYAEQAKKDERLFDVHGLIYEKEFVVIVSYLDQNDYLTAPISLFISHDIISDEKKMKKALQNVIDLTGEIFDDIFAIADWNDYNPNWTENQYKDNTFHYKITRENITLSLQAEEILKREGKLDQ